MPRLPYVDPRTNERLREHLETSRRLGTPLPQTQAIRAHHPPILELFSRSWSEVYHNGVLGLDIKEPCRLYISRTVGCEH